MGGRLEEARQKAASYAIALETLNTLNRVQPQLLLELSRIADILLANFRIRLEFTRLSPMELLIREAERNALITGRSPAEELIKLLPLGSVVHPGPGGSVSPGNINAPGFAGGAMGGTGIGTTFNVTVDGSLDRNNRARVARDIATQAMLQIQRNAA